MVAKSLLGLGERWHDLFCRRVRQLLALHLAGGPFPRPPANPHCPPANPTTQHSSRAALQGPRLAVLTAARS